MPTSGDPPAHQPHPESDDAALVARIRGPGEGAKADPEALESLLRRHQDLLFATCQRMVGPRDAADLCQTALVKIIQGLSGFDGRAQFSTWAVRIAMNACLSHLRAERLRRHAALPDSEEVLAGAGSNREPASTSNVQDPVERRRLLRALDRLDGEQRAMIVLRDVQGLDYAQIAAVLEVAEGTVKSRLFRAREALRTAMTAVLKDDGVNS
ncbi:MAG: RNA polymerase sigma factor [Phycisphaerales bacterium]